MVGELPTAAPLRRAADLRKPGWFAPGDHRVVFDSDVDTITLEHSARSRGGFALGALLAAEWIRGRSGLYGINDLMNSIIGGVSNQ